MSATPCRDPSPRRARGGGGGGGGGGGRLGRLGRLPLSQERELHVASNITVPTELLMCALCAKLGVAHSGIEGGIRDESRRHFLRQKVEETPLYETKGGGDACEHESHVDELSALLRMQASLPDLSLSLYIYIHPFSPDGTPRFSPHATPQFFPYMCTYIYTYSYIYTYICFAPYAAPARSDDFVTLAAGCVRSPLRRGRMRGAASKTVPNSAHCDSTSDTRCLSAFDTLAFCSHVTLAFFPHVRG